MSSVQRAVVGFTEFQHHNRPLAIHSATCLMTLGAMFWSRLHGKPLPCLEQSASEMTWPGHFAWVLNACTVDVFGHPNNSGTQSPHGRSYFPSILRSVVRSSVRSFLPSLLLFASFLPSFVP